MYDNNFPQTLSVSIRDVLSGILVVADPAGSSKFIKASINSNRLDAHVLYFLVDGLFNQLQDILTSGTSDPGAFENFLSYLADYFNRASRGAALETFQMFSIGLERLYLATYGFASTVEKSGPLTPSTCIRLS